MNERFRPGLDSFPGRAELLAVCEVADDPRELGAAVLTFKHDSAITTIRIEYTDDSLCITNMTTLPSSEQSKGYGKSSLGALLAWAKKQGFADVVATQVQYQSAGFWQACGFERVENSPTNDYRFVASGTAVE